MRRLGRPCRPSAVPPLLGFSRWAPHRLTEVPARARHEDRRRKAQQIIRRRSLATPAGRHHNSGVFVQKVTRLLGPLALVTGLVFCTAPAPGAPPPPGSDARERLLPYSDAIKGLTQPGTGRGCCDLSDCRTVEIRINRNGSYEALIPPFNPETGDGFPGGPGRFLEVPPEVILPPDKRNRLPITVACWANWSHTTNGFLCFVPGPGS